MDYVACNITMYGNCREAIGFYEKCFNITDKEIVTFGEVADQLNFGSVVQGKEDMIYQAKLFFPCTEGKFVLMMGDSPSILFNDSTNGNCKDNITLNIGFSEEVELAETYEKLAVSGKNNIKPRSAGQGITEGSLIDKFGICWILRTIQK